MAQRMKHIFRVGIDRVSDLFRGLLGSSCEFFARLKKPPYYLSRNLTGEKSIVGRGRPVPAGTENFHWRDDLRVVSKDFRDGTEPVPPQITAA